ncbi:MAG: hypothetical protein IPN86_14600 [Saprospiraceae bacterium]|nr:hypothetical protein [Saprospiraceae bacterium]
MMAVVTNYVQLEVSGGQGSYTFDWDHDGWVIWDDKSYYYSVKMKHMR